MLVSYSSSSEEEADDLPFDSPKRKRFKNDDSLLLKTFKSVTNTGSTCICDKPSSRNAQSEEHSNRKPSRLPLPDSVLEMFADVQDSDTEVDALQHSGRIRSFKHEQGNWATYVYLPYFPEEEFVELLGTMTAVAASHGISLTLSDEFHLSLSQTVVLRHHWIQPFIQSLRTGLAHCKRSVCCADKLKVYSNSEKTRTFLGMEVSSGHAQLLELVRAVDKAVEEFDLSTFYQNPSFHVSLAWCVGDFSEEMQKVCLPLLQGLVDTHEDGPFLVRLDCHEVRCKSGNKIFSIPLQ